MKPFMFKSIRETREQGFTLIEILLVVTIIGIMLAVIVPRAHRATIDSKYNLIRQGATEVASYALEWAEKGIQSQDSKTSIATIKNYLASLSGARAWGHFNSAGDNRGEWIAGSLSGGSNWNTRTGTLTPVLGRVNVSGGASNQRPPMSVEALMPSSDIPINPFNGVNVFAAPNYPTGAGVPVTGALACVLYRQPNGFIVYSFCFQGTDSIGFNQMPANRNGIFYAGQNRGNSVMALRNGVVIAEER